MPIKVHSFLFETDESESGDVLLCWLLYHSSSEIKCLLNAAKRLLFYCKSENKAQYHLHLT